MDYPEYIHIAARMLNIEPRNMKYAYTKTFKALVDADRMTACLNGRLISRQAIAMIIVSIGETPNG